MASEKEKNNGGYDAEAAAAAARAARIAQIRAQINALQGEKTILENEKAKYEKVKTDAINIINHIEEFITNLNRTGIAFSDIVLSGEAFDQGDFQNETKIFNEYKSNFDDIVTVCDKKIAELAVEIQKITTQITQLYAELVSLGA